MKKKDIDLFDKAIHNVKGATIDIVKERNRYHLRLDKLMKQIKYLRNSHDKKIKKIIKEQKEVLEEMYELFDDLTNSKGE